MSRRRTGMSALIAGGAALCFAAHPTSAPAEPAADTTGPETATAPAVTELDPQLVVEPGAPLDSDQRLRIDTRTVVEREAMEQQHASVVFDTLEKKPGLAVNSRTGFNGTGMNRLSIRGLGAVGPSGVQVFIDGRPDPTASFVHPIGQALGVERMRRVEVIHGPSPVLHGSGKAGVVEIQTMRPRPGLSGFLQTQGGSFGSTENMAVIGYGSDEGFLRVSGNFRRTDGDIDETFARVWQINLRAGHALSPHWEIEGSVGRSSDRFETPGEINVVGPFGSPGTERLDLVQTTGDLKLTARYGGVVSSLQLWANDLSPRSQATPEGVSRADVYETGLRFRNRIALPAAQTLILGTDVVHASAENTPPPPPGNRPPAPDAPRLDVDTTEIGPYLLLEGTLLPWLDWRGGVRVVEHSEQGTEPVGELGFRLTPLLAMLNDGTSREGSFRLRATRGYQSAPLQQLFGVFTGGEAGPSNRDLEPERLDQIELGWSQRVGRFEWDLVGWIQDGEDLVQLVGPPPPSLENRGSFTNRGLELRTALRPLPGLMLGIGGSWQSLDDSLLRVPTNTLDFELSYATRRLGGRELALGFFGRHAVRTFDVTENGRERLSDYTVVDFKAVYHASPSVRPFVQVDNLTDADYETWAGIPMPGIAASVGVTVSF